MCSVARTNDLSKRTNNLKGSSPNKPKLSPHEPKVVKVCSKCYTVIQPGKPHRCSKHTKVENLAQMAGGDVDKLVVKSLRSRNCKKDDILLKNLRGKATDVKVMIGSDKKGKLSHRQILNIKNQLDLSTRKVRFILNCLQNRSVGFYYRLPNLLEPSVIPMLFPYSLD